MDYIDVLWRHDDADYPHRCVSALNSERWEVRRLEFFRSGAVGSASHAGRTIGTGLGEWPMPPLDEINADPELEGRVIDAEAFERLWRRHGRIPQPFDTVDVIAAWPAAPEAAAGSIGTVLDVVARDGAIACDVECVDEAGRTVWRATLPRSVLRLRDQER